MATSLSCPDTATVPNMMVPEGLEARIVPMVAMYCMIPLCTEAVTFPDSSVPMVPMYAIVPMY